MTKFDILTLFPEMFTPLKVSVIGRAEKKELIKINAINFRDFSNDPNKRVDDVLYGGGAGMLLTPQPIFSALENLDPFHRAYRIYMSPKGTPLTASKAKMLAKMEKHVIVLCGHYEGVDQRVIDTQIDEEISIGNYVVTGGELPAMVMIDAIARFVPGVINQDSLVNESFENDLLECPQYTRPANYNGMRVPDVLLSGNHAEIEKWRKAHSKYVGEVKPEKPTSKPQKKIVKVAGITL